MATKTTASPKEETLQIKAIETGKMTVRLVGVSPLIFNAMSEKARHTLLLPSGRMSAVEKETNQKHDPLTEYRGSIYAYRTDDNPTRLMFPCGGFKKGMMTAALDSPGAKKAVIGRLLWIESRDVPIYGIPQLLMSITRSADMNRTPDVRTRAIVERWACILTISFVSPRLDTKQVLNLLQSAGLTCGIGDWRQEKGSGDFGRYRIANKDDADFISLMENGGREAQDAALADPSTYDHETDQLLSWYMDEMKERNKRKEMRKQPIEVEAA